MADPAGTGDAPDRRRLLIGGAHLAALWTLAFVQPLLDLLGRNPDFFIARGNKPVDILALAFGVTLIPPALMLLAEGIAARIGGRAYRVLHFALLALLGLFLAIRPLGSVIGARSAVILALALLLGVLLAVAIFRSRFARNLMDILAIAPLVVLVAFVFFSPARQVIFPGGGELQLARDSGDDHPVVLLIFDELPTATLMAGPDRLDGNRFPNLAGLAGEATWYLNHSTEAYLTPIAVPQILTGTDRPPDTLPTWQERPDSIFSQFARDRKLHVSEPLTYLCPRDLCPREDGSFRERMRALLEDLKHVEGRLVLPPGMASRFGNINTTFGGFGGDRTQKQDSRFGFAGRVPSSRGYERLARTIPASRRGLTVLHLSSLPHQAWKLDLDGNTYNASNLSELLEEQGRNWAVNSNGIATAQARMYTETGFGDRLVGIVRQRLRETGLWQRALVIVTADHGISFEGGRVPQRRLSPRVMGEVANPPLLIKYPGQRRGRISRRPTRTFDIVPTIARALGVKELYPNAGVALQGPVPDRPVRLVSPGGREVTVPVREMVRQRNEAIERAGRRLGRGPFYTLGAKPGLLGRQPPPVPPGRSEAWLEEPGLWRNYRPGRDRIPMFVTGRLRQELPAAAAEAPVIAVTVNGVVRGTGRGFVFRGESRFGMLVDPESLKPGRNRIGIYLVRGDRLLPLGSG